MGQSLRGHVAVSGGPPRGDRADERRLQTRSRHGDWETLRDFIVEEACRHPAHHYLVVIASHGSGIFGPKGLLAP